MYYFKGPLTALLTKHRISQRELVRASGVSQGMITKLLSDKGCKSVDLYKLSLICNELNVKPWRLIKQAEE